jgi:hypothetical protein
MEIMTSWRALIPEPRHIYTILHIPTIPSFTKLLWVSASTSLITFNHHYAGRFSLVSLTSTTEITSSLRNNTQVPRFV